MIITDTALIEQKIDSQLNSATKGYLSLDRHDYEIVSLGKKSMVIVEVNNKDFNEAIIELEADLTKLSPVDGDMLIWIKSSALTMEQLSLCLGNDCYERYFSFDVETTAKFETRFQAMGNSEAFLWKLREVYVRSNDDAEKVLSRILAYCDRKGMRRSESCYCSYDEE